jgi:hypothetical protein
MRPFDSHGAQMPPKPTTDDAPGGLRGWRAIAEAVVAQSEARERWGEPRERYVVRVWFVGAGVSKM